VGAFVFGSLVSASQVLESNAPAGEMLRGMLEAKSHETPLELFVRGVLCNVLVCLAIWMCARLTSDGPKLVVIFWALLAFIASGFEHVVANMTTFAIGITSGYEHASLADFGNNLLWVGLGNLVGGAVFVGLAYWFVAGSPRVSSTAALDAHEESIPA
jgi:nitrite transporter NirC